MKMADPVAVIEALAAARARLYRDGEFGLYDAVEPIWNRAVSAGIDEGVVVDLLVGAFGGAAAELLRDAVADELPADNAALGELVLQTDARQGDVLLQRLHDVLGRFVAYPSSEAQVAHALWIVHCHLMAKWESTPRIFFGSPEPASGKTRALEITERLVPNAVCAINVSPAYLFRKVGGDEVVTVLFDEVDTIFGPKAKEHEEIRALLNAGHRRGAVAGRCVVRGKIIDTEEIPAYAAVALAGLGWLPDTILSRSVVIRMRRRRVDQHVEPFRPRLHEAALHKLRDQIAAWAEANADAINWPQMPAEIIDRDADLWEPLLAVADACGGDWPELARKAAKKLVAAGKDAEPSLGIRLLTDLRQIFGDDRMAIFTKALLEELKALPEAPWADLYGKGITDRILASRLRAYEIRSIDIRIGNKTGIKGYQRADFVDVWARYLPPPSKKSATSATPATSDADDVARL